MTIAEITTRYQSGLITTGQLIKETLDNLETGNKRLNAATAILNDEAISLANKPVEGPLKGIPFSIKECYALAGKTITSASKRMAPIVCTEDAMVVQKLIKAGAIPVARGNTTEFLMGRESTNLVYGTTNNAINPALSSGGSSGGDAALVGAGLVPFGIGTDIGGSVRYPAGFNGIVGFKPASGQIDATGMFPLVDHFANAMNSPGIMCNNVHDARLVYNVLGNKVLNHDADISQVQIYTSHTFKVSIADASIKKALAYSIEYLRTKSFAKVVDLKIPELGELHNDFIAIMGDGFVSKIFEWSSSGEYGKLTIMGELLNRLLGKPTMSTELFLLLPSWNIIRPSKSKTASIIEKVKLLREKYEKLLGHNGVLVLPTIGILAPKHGRFLPKYLRPGVVRSITPVAFCNILNFSCITLPAHKFQKNPSTNPPGIQLITRQGNEELLLNVAEVLEKGIG